jgi:transcriptional regulator with XRE-family HTH domain
MNVTENLYMVDNDELPVPPDHWPDPAQFRNFGEWMRELTKKPDGVKQVTIAKVAGVKPQAVTKWVNGGSIEVDKLMRIAQWAELDFDELRRLVDDGKLTVARVAEPRERYVISKAAGRRTEELLAIWAKLSPENRQQYLGMGKALVATQVKKPTR